MSTWAIVVAAGSGSRFGAEKQFLPLGHQRLVDWSASVAGDTCDGVVLVVAADRVALDKPAGVDVVVAGGASRSQSVRAGLAAVPSDSEVIVVHDAARPCVSKEAFRAVIGAISVEVAGAFPALPVTDTIKRVPAQPTASGAAAVLETIDRSELVAAQTPQAFKAEVLRRVHAKEPEGSDDAMLVEMAGEQVHALPGDARNIKVTYPDDLERVRQWVAS